MTAKYLVLGATFAFAAAVQPGPLQAYLISQSLSRGWRGVLPAVFAPLISDVPIIILAVLVLTALPQWVISILQIAGGGFLLYLAGQAWRSSRNQSGRDSPDVQTGRQTLLRAVMVNLLNPNPYLGWSLVMGPLLLEGWRLNPMNALGLLLGFYGTMVISLVGIVLLFSAAGNLGPTVRKVLLVVSVVALAAFGLYLLWSGFGNVR